MLARKALYQKAIGVFERISPSPVCLRVLVHHRCRSSRKRRAMSLQQRETGESREELDMVMYRGYTDNHRAQIEVTVTMEKHVEH